MKSFTQFLDEAKAKKQKKQPTLDDLKNKYNRQLDSKKRVTGRSLQKSREAIIKKRFDMGFEHVIMEEKDSPIAPGATKKHPTKWEVEKHFNSSWTPHLSRDEAHTEYTERFGHHYTAKEIDDGVLDDHAVRAVHYYKNGKWPKK